MANANQGAIRPKSARSQSVINADGTTDTIRWISEPTAI
jgi:hypothetical protein